ncbi:MAG: hypothetical protein ACO1OX_07860 [Novosphingobium sp.]
MEPTLLSQIVANFGPAGAFVSYLIWQQMRRDKIDQERVETDKALATALANLTNAINNERGR